MVQELDKKAKERNPQKFEANLFYRIGDHNIAVRALNLDLVIIDEICEV